jgi:hypothetical protein
MHWLSQQCYYLFFKGFLIWKTPANWYILVGAIIFVSSDSILAFNKFYNLLYCLLLIMITYLVAQYLIVSGILKIKKNSISILENAIFLLLRYLT